MAKITISAPNEILRSKVERFVRGHRIFNIEWGENIAIITYYN